ncbi:hypothetical protein Bbelb_140070 [Branchiostoma belcheri]|nr:hypothetical protein Bbelb_140070 [Branchiostoma belcheri]
MKPLEIQTGNAVSYDGDELTPGPTEDCPPVYVEPSAEDEKRAHFMRWKMLRQIEGIAAPRCPLHQFSTATSHHEIALPLLTQKDSDMTVASGNFDTSYTGMNLSLRALTSPRSDRKIRSMLDPTTGGSLSSSCDHQHYELPHFQHLLNRMVFEVDNLAKQSEAVQAKVDKLNGPELEVNASSRRPGGVTSEEMSDLKERVSAVQTMLSEFNLTARGVCEDIRLIKAGSEELRTRVQETDSAMRRTLSEVNSIKLEQRSLSRSIDDSSRTKTEILAELKDLRNKSMHPTSPNQRFFSRQAPRTSTESYPQRLRKRPTFTKLSFNLDFGTPIIEESSEESTRTSTPESQTSFTVGDQTGDGLGLARVEEDLEANTGSSGSSGFSVPSISTSEAEPENLRRVRHPQFPWDRPGSPEAQTDEGHILPTSLEDDKMDRLHVTHRALFTMSPSTFAKIARHRGVSDTKSSFPAERHNNANLSAKKDSLSCIFCKKTFKKRENNGKACQFHRGYFDKKNQCWTCCRKLGRHAKTCAVGRHFPTNR